jgi:hypothetical protein
MAISVANPMLPSASAWPTRCYDYCARYDNDSTTTPVDATPAIGTAMKAYTTTSRHFNDHARWSFILCEWYGLCSNRRQPNSSNN